MLRLLAVALFSLPQATNPPYMAQFPSVDRVKKAMQDKDPREQALKQMGALWQLQEIIRQLSGRREFRGLLPDEAKVLGEYQVAEYYVGTAIDSAFPGPYGNWKKVSMNTPYRYMRTDPRFGVEGINIWALLPAAVADSFYRSVGNDKARIAARARADSEAMRAAQAPPSETNSLGLPTASQDQARIRRCVESGRSQTQCIMEGLGQSVKDLAGAVMPGLGAMMRRDDLKGIRMGGVYPGANRFSLTFYTENVIVGCGEIIPAAHEYTTAMVPEGVRITISNEPRPIVLTMKSDGRLWGTGPVDVVGQVQVGTEYGTRTWSDGRTEPISRPVYATRTPRCTVTSLAASGGTPAGGASAGTAVVSTMSLLFGGSGEDLKPTPAGLRLNGEYGTQAALDIDFRPEGAVLGCGAVTALKPYTMRVVPNGSIAVTIANDAPLSLTLGRDGRLTGSGTVKVDGRVVTGTSGNGNLTYAPRSASCALGTIGPAQRQLSEAEQGAAAARASLGQPSGPPASPEPSGNGPAFQIVGGLPAPAYGGNALSGAALLLMDAPLDNIIKEAGVAVPAGTSAPRALEQTCNGVAGQANCAKIVQALGKHTVAQLKADANGIANTPDLAAGRTYYLFGSAVSQGKKVTWHLPLKAAPGWTKVVLTTGNAVP